MFNKFEGESTRLLHTDPRLTVTYIQVQQHRCIFKRVLLLQHK